jgi:putative ABC transport system permease protein
VTLLTLVAAAAGALLANITAALIPPDVPFALSNGTVVIYGIVLVLVSGLAALLSAVRIARIDPLIAIGRVE